MFTASATQREGETGGLMLGCTQSEKGVRVRVHAVHRDDGSVESYWLQLGVNGGSLSIHGFSRDSAERFVADIYNAVHDALHPQAAPAPVVHNGTAMAST